MNAKRVIWGVTAASLVMPVSVSVGRAQGAPHEGHTTPTAHANLRGPLPEAVRVATDGFQDVNAAIAAGYVSVSRLRQRPRRRSDGRSLCELRALRRASGRPASPGAGATNRETAACTWSRRSMSSPPRPGIPAHDPSAKPQLTGHLYHFAAGPNRYGPDAFYELHVWAWKDNPRGTFADWNPNVSCAEWETAGF